MFIGKQAMSHTVDTASIILGFVWRKNLNAAILDGLNNAWSFSLQKSLTDSMIAAEGKCFVTIGDAIKTIFFVHSIANQVSKFMSIGRLLAIYKKSGLYISPGADWIRLAKLFDQTIW